jgi:hypothetical protein
VGLIPDRNEHFQLNLNTQKEKNLWALVNFLSILKDLDHTSPDVE